MTETPLPTVICTWCGSGVSASSKICGSCFLPVEQVIVPTVTRVAKTGNAPAKREPKPKSATRPAIVFQDPATAIKESMAQGNVVVVGIDPGARYVGFCVRDNKNNIFISSTFRRPDEIPDAVDWAKKTLVVIASALEGIEYHIMGIEGTTDPKGFKHGKQDALNPRDIIRTGIVVGALAVTYPDAYIIRPRGNGDKPDEEYPVCLVGQRPKDLPGQRDPGVTVRKHERSAYDVAEHALFEHMHSVPSV